MEETIFNNKQIVSGSANLLSFKDCPNKCTDGYYVDPYQHKRIKCKYCEQKRIEIVKNRVDAMDMSTNQNIEKVLKLPKYLNGINYDENSLISKGIIDSLDKAKLADFYNELNELMNNASIGEFPDYSIIINFGMKAYHYNFIYPYMMRLYMNGVSLCPLLTAFDVYNARYEENYSETELGVKFVDLLKREGCVIFIDAGSAERDVYAVKGLMELRAMRNKSTLIVTGSWTDSVKRIETEDLEARAKNLAHLIAIPFKPYENKNDKKIIPTNNGSISSSQMKGLMSYKNNT